MVEQPSSSAGQTATSTWPDWQKQIVGVLLLLLVPVALYFLRPVLGPLLFTFAVAFVLMYPIRLLQRWVKLSYRLSALLVYFVFLLLSLGLIGWFVSNAVGSLADAVQSSREFIQQLVAGVSAETEGGLRGALNLDFISDGLKALSLVGTGVSLLSSPADFVAAIVDRVSVFTSFVGGYGFMIVLLLFFLLEWPRTQGLIGRSMPDASRREYAILIRRIVSLGQSYLLGSLLIVLFYWLVTTILFALSGVPYPLVLGLLVAIPNFIPQAGSLVSAILVFAITLALGSTSFAVDRLTFAFIEMIIFMVISGLAYYFVGVRIYSKSVRMPVWIILVGIVVFVTVMGVIGAFIAPAAVAIMGEMLGFTLKKLRGEEPYPDEAEAPMFGLAPVSVSEPEPVIEGSS